MTRVSKTAIFTSTFRQGDPEGWSFSWGDHVDGHRIVIDWDSGQPPVGNDWRGHLRGAVLPVGGIKEKVLAAHRAGIKMVILPEKNRKDLPDVPDEIKEDLEIHFCSRMEDVLDLALGADNIEQRRKELEIELEAKKTAEAAGGEALA